MTEEIINLKDYFVHHYDDWGRLYCVEFKGSPLELENSIKRLEQESKDFEILAKSLYKRIEELEKENEALAFRERLYKTDYKASEQENKEIYENGQIEITKLCNEKTKYRSALEEIREKIKSLNKDICNNCGWYNTDNCQPNGYVCNDLIEIKNKINEVLR